MSVRQITSGSSQTEMLADYVDLVVRDRDQRAFEHLFDFYAPRIKAYLMRGNCPSALAEEITQDVMTTLWQKAHQFDRTKSSIGTWLFRIARNRRIDLIRGDKSDRMDTNDPTMFPQTVEIDQHAADGARRDKRIRKALSQLPKEQSQLLRCSFFENMSHGEIAEKLDLPLGTVKSRIRLSFNHLRKALIGDDQVEL